MGDKGLGKWKKVRRGPKYVRERKGYVDREHVLWALMCGVGTYDHRPFGTRSLDQGVKISFCMNGDQWRQMWTEEKDKQCYFLKSVICSNIYISWKSEEQEIENSSKRSDPWEQVLGLQLLFKKCLWNEPGMPEWVTRGHPGRNVQRVKSELSAQYRN